MVARFLSVAICMMSTCLYSDTTDTYFQHLNQHLEQITQVIQSAPTPQKLYQSTEQLETLVEKSNQCVAEAQDSLKSLNSLLVNTQPDSNVSNNTYSYHLLLGTINEYKQRILDCSLFSQSLRIQQKAAQKIIRAMPKTNLFDRVLPVWKIQLPVIKHSVSMISANIFYEHSGLSELNNFQRKVCLWYLLVWLLVAALAYLVPGMRSVWLKTVPIRFKPWYGLTQQLVFIVIPVCLFYIMLRYMFVNPLGTPSVLTILSYLCVSIMALCFITALLQIYLEKIYITNVMYYYNVCATILLPISAVLMVNISRQMSFDHAPHVLFNSPFVYSVVYVVIIAKLSAIILMRDALAFSAAKAQQIYKYLCVLIVTLLSFTLLKFFLEIVRSNLQVIWLIGSFAPVVINAILLRILWIIFVVESTIHWSRQLKNTMIGGYITLIFLGFCGYHVIAIMLILNLVASWIIISLLVDTFKFLHDLYINLSEPNQTLSIRLRAIIGVKSEHKLVELYILMLVLYITLIAVSVIALIYIWHLLSVRFMLRDLFVYSNDGYNLMGIIVYPLSVLRSMCIFSLWIFFGRIFISFVVLKRMSFDSPNTQKKVISVLSFVFLACGLLIFLDINHVNLRSFVVIAGALSFGIGFGFQSFATDLISGWLLLVNKPFATGDHIIVGSYRELVADGIVINIGALSTHLITSKKSDIFIPNAVFTKTAVVNLTYKANKLSRITLHVILDDLSDAHLARELLLSIGEKNNNIKLLGVESPQVLFNYHGLDLSVVIINIEKKKLIISALIFEIEETFAANNIKMSFGES